MTRLRFLARLVWAANFLVLICFLGQVGHARSQPVSLKIYLVRHAEIDGGGDPPLNATGRKRAADLADVLRNADIDAIFTSPYRRTQQTAAPLAKARGISPVPIEITSIEAHVTGIADAVRNRRGGAALVVGHSNTVPAVIARLGGPRLPNLCETTFDVLFRVEMKDGKTDLKRMRYGDRSPPGNADCL